ncbi:MAG: thiol-disulfide isomerase [Acidobacteriota bacterium]|nr:thiol-disulfide isomerase [Acidobacteriota bacterium]
MKRTVARVAISALFVIPAFAAGPTFTRDVAPILYKHCAQCHHANDIAPMSLLTYKEVRPWAASIREAVARRTMPPWKADRHVGKWSNDPSLSTAEIGTITAWVDGGKLEGDPKALPPVPVFAEGWHAGKPDQVIAIPTFTLTDKGPDEYHYFDVATNFTEDMWIVSAELRPGNRKIVHHAHVFVVEPQKPAAAKSKPDPATEYSRWLHVNEGSLVFIRPTAPVINDGCATDDNGAFPGSPPNDLGSLIASYLPGRGPDVYPEGSARLVPAGSKLKFQIHYSRATGKVETDETAVGLIFAKQAPKQVARRIDLSNHMFLIPARDGNHQVTECHTFQKDMFITSLTPHMHLRGKAMRMEVTYPDGRSQTLLNVPEYNFNWQITYHAAEPIFIPKGTRLKIDARFDNSANNPLNPDPSKPIRWGAASEVEMMDGWIEYVDAGSSGAGPRATATRD